MILITVPPNYNFIFTCMDMQGNMTWVRGILLHVLCSHGPATCGNSTCTTCMELQHNSHMWTCVLKKFAKFLLLDVGSHDL